MIVDEVTQKKAGFFVRSITGNGSGIQVLSEIDNFCKKDPARCLAVFQNLPVGNVLCGTLYEKALVISNEQPESLIAAAVVYIMSNITDQEALQLKLKALALKYPETWEMIKGESDLKDF
jgi:hypothetical protein